MKKIFTLISICFVGAVAIAQADVTFQVDVTNYVAGGAIIDGTGLRIAGNFSANSGTANGGPMADYSPTHAGSAMTDIGNNIWEIVVTFPAAGGNLSYKFVNGNWGMSEGIDPLNTIISGGCGVSVVSPNGAITYRTLVIPSVGTTIRYCWDMCLYACNGSGANVTEGSISNLVVSPNPATDVATFAFETNENHATVTIFDLSGKTVAEQTAVTGASNQIEMNTANLMAGYYIYSVKAGDDVVTGKLMKK
jgi:hypothetical protein